MQEKQCPKCGGIKPIGEFYKHKSRLDGHQSQCKECIKEYLKRPEVKERRREVQKRYYKRPEIKAKQIESNAEFRKRNPQYDKIYNKLEYVQYRRQTLRRGYSQQGKVAVWAAVKRTRKAGLPSTLTRQQWQNSLNYFNGCCAVCGRQLNDMFGEFTAAMDHWIPLSYEGGDNPGTVAINIVPLCHGVDGCNNRKHNTMPNEWLDREYSKHKAAQIAENIQMYFDSLEDEETKNE